MSTLSDATTSNTSPAVTLSPIFLFQLTIVPSVIVEDNAGMLTSPKRRVVKVCIRRPKDGANDVTLLIKKHKTTHNKMKFFIFALHYNDTI